MKIIAKTLTMFAALSAFSLPQQAHAADDACLALKDFKLAGGRIDSVGTMTPPEPLDLGIKGVPPLPVLNTYCRVQGRLTPTPGSDIRIEVWLPPKEKWNGKFLGAGNAGYAGNFTSPYLFMGNAVGHGYASAGTDTGHVNGQMGDRAASGAGWALGQPEKVIDYGNRANHLTAA
ncbi:MAG TPA: tannase/feruloyl esterase family alpha/beta hydrolase, partial [Pseudolabrys sp.]